MGEVLQLITERSMELEYDHFANLNKSVHPNTEREWLQNLQEQTTRHQVPSDVEHTPFMKSCCFQRKKESNLIRSSL